jgi:ferredoxin
MAEGLYREGIVGGRLAPDNMPIISPTCTRALDHHEALVESDRCYFCYDAPCMNACPTSIDIPMFIRQISTGNPIGSAKTIFDQNILGGMCARVCPTETLVRGGLRPRDGGGQAGADRPPAALRHRCGHGAGHSNSISAPPRPARPSPWSAPARRALPPRTVSLATAMT